MMLTRRSAAARNALAALITTAMITLPTVTLAGEGQPSLLLPLMAAIALATGGSHAMSAADAPRTGGFSIIPPHMHIPDLYALDDDRDPARFAEPLDNDRLFSIDLMPHPQKGWMAYLVYDSESPQVLGKSSSIVRIRFEYDFN